MLLARSSTTSLACNPRGRKISSNFSLSWCFSAAEISLHCETILSSRWMMSKAGDSGTAAATPTLAETFTQQETVNRDNKNQNLNFNILSIPSRAPIVAMWADRFSRYCWRRFSRFLLCPSTLPPVSASASCYLSRSTPLLLPWQGRGGGRHWVNMGQAKRLRLQQLDCHWGEVLNESSPWLLLLLLLVAPLWLLVILMIAYWICCSIIYEIRISWRFSRDWPIDRSPNAISPSSSISLLLCCKADIPSSKDESQRTRPQHQNMSSWWTSIVLWTQSC